MLKDVNDKNMKEKKVYIHFTFTYISIQKKVHIYTDYYVGPMVKFVKGRSLQHLSLVSDHPLSLLLFYKCGRKEKENKTTKRLKAQL